RARGRARGHQHPPRAAQPRNAVPVAHGSEARLMPASRDADRPLSRARVFGALLARDVTVARRELVYFLLRTAMQPLLFTIVFGYIMPKLGYVRTGYTAALLPGVLAVSLALAAVQSVALPMVTDFGFSREIEDRLLAPIPNWLVALEKVVSGVLQA